MPAANIQKRISIILTGVGGAKAGNNIVAAQRQACDFLQRGIAPARLAALQGLRYTPRLAAPAGV
jgi:hypothetical protein